jgi:hypothetical protein
MVKFWLIFAGILILWEIVANIVGIIPTLALTFGQTIIDTLINGPVH